MKPGCWSHWVYWGCWGHWGHLCSWYLGNNIIQGVSEWTDKSKSALRGREINNFIALWCLVPSGGVGICVSSKQFSKKWLASTASQQKKYQISVKNWIFDDPIYQKGLLLVIWVLGMINRSNDQTIMISGFFDDIRLLRSLRPLRSLRLQWF